MNKSLESIKNNAPAFNPIFNYIKKIIETDGPTFELVNLAVKKMAKKYLAGIRNKRILTFLCLPATSHSKSRLVRRSLLEEVILSGLEQALALEPTMNCFTVSVMNTVLHKKHFYFIKSMPENTDSFGKMIEKRIPQIVGMSFFGNGPKGDEVYFSLHYDYRIK